ncbi:MAG: putative selenate reductase subunit YgfK [Lachnospiraceae bacterium]|nr:putative selenate reductase subunit YgfK [Lachnospiraceae bacterium]
MINNLRPLEFGHLMRWILNEQKKSGSIFGVRDFYQANPFKTLNVFDEKLETPFGPASGPHTQYAQSLIAAYVAGCRFFELRTVCPRELKQDPEIAADSEGYNVEGAVNLTIRQSFDEYVKAWIAIKVLSVEYEMGGMDGFVFNESAGYTLSDYKSPAMTEFLNNMRDASDTPIFKECIAFLKDNIDLFQNLTLEDIDDISPKISTSVSVCTPFDCPLSEIESIAKYLMIDCGLNIGIRLDTTLLGYDYCRSTLDSMGYFDIEINKDVIAKCVRYHDMIPLINRLLGIANKEGRLFGVKITGVFPVVDKGDRSRSLKLSGKALFPLSVALAARLSDDFEGRLRIGFSGGADANNVEDIFEAGVWPITMNTTILKPGGFNRFKQFSYTFNEWSYNEYYGTQTGLLKRMAERVRLNNHYTKPLKSDVPTKRKGRIPKTNCFIAPCVDGCPIGQDITTCLSFIDEENYIEALRVMLEKNPLPFTTGSICTHECMTNCTRIYYEKSVKIREANLIAAQNGYETVIGELRPKVPVGRSLKIAIVGGGPAGMAAAFFLAHEGHRVTMFCAREHLGGVARHLIPDFRMPIDRSEKDASFLKALNVEVRSGVLVKNLSEIQGYDKTILAIGAPCAYDLDIPGINVVSAISFLEDYKERKGRPDLGKNVAVIGGNDTAVDAARAAKRIKGVENVYIIYRRNRRFMKANDEELQTAITEGIELMELMNPFEYVDGYLKCHITELKEPGDDGRLMPYDTDEVMAVPADTVIAAIGVHVDSDFYRNNGINVGDNGLPVVDPDTYESNIPNVFIAGDGRVGSASVVEAIADARKVADAILKEFENMVPEDNGEYHTPDGYVLPGFANTRTAPAKRVPSRRSADNKLSGLYAKKGILREPHYRNDGGRCLDCSRLCENCIDVCPNRANVEIKVPGNPTPQVLHIDRLCNECGNCDTFCPYEGAPYKEKFTLFDTIEDFEAGTNEGLVFTHDGSAFTIRLKKKKRKRYGDNMMGESLPAQEEEIQVFRVSRIEAAEFNGISTDLCNLIATIYQDYRYLII